MISTYAQSKNKINATEADPDAWALDLEDIEKGGRLLVKLRVHQRKAIGDKTRFEKGDILYSKLRPYLLKILIADEDGICTPEIVPFKVYGGISSEYMVAYLQSPYVDSTINAVTYGVKMPRVGTETMVSFLVPLPPIKEQYRIVEKIKELLPTIAQYDVVERSLVSLNEEFPGLLRKSILQLAVQGKLVPQDPSDEPASILLERIHTEKERLIAAGKIKRDKHESVIFRRDNSHYEKSGTVERCIDDELPFEIPDSWCWTRLGCLLEEVTSGSRDWAQFYSSTGAIFLRMGNLSKDSFRLRLDKIQRVSLPENTEGKRTSLQQGDLLFSITADIGNMGLIPEGFGEAYINQHTAMLRFMTVMRNEYIPYCLLCDYAQRVYKKQQHGIKNSFRLDTIQNILIPVPPLKEQHRILQKLSKLFSIDMISL